jgi:8-oxo-dGTP diphosphatase
MEKSNFSSEGVSFLVIKDGMILAEKRKLTKRLDPGAVTIPGGFMEAGESPEEAVRRECKEELGLTLGGINYVCTLLYQVPELSKVHYYAAEEWDGELENNEAEALLWLPLADASRLDVYIDRVALSEYLRIYASRTADY